MATEDSSQPVLEQNEVAAAAPLHVATSGLVFFNNQLFGYANQAFSTNNSLNQTIVSKAADMILTTSPSEGASDQTMAAILAKVAQTTHPISAGSAVSKEG